MCVCVYIYIYIYIINIRIFYRYAHHIGNLVVMYSPVISVSVSGSTFMCHVLWSEEKGTGEGGGGIDLRFCIAFIKTYFVC